MGNEISSADVLQKLKVDREQGVKLCRQYCHAGFEAGVRKQIYAELLDVERLRGELTARHGELGSVEKMRARHCDDARRDEVEACASKDAPRLGLASKQAESRYVDLVGVLAQYFKVLGWASPACGCSGLSQLLVVCFDLYPAADEDEAAVWFVLAAVERLRYTAARDYFSVLRAPMAVFQQALRDERPAAQLAECADLSFYQLAKGHGLADDARLRYWDVVFSFGWCAWIGIAVAIVRDCQPPHPDFDQLMLSLRTKSSHILPYLPAACKYLAKNEHRLNALIIPALLNDPPQPNIY